MSFCIKRHINHFKILFSGLHWSPCSMWRDLIKFLNLIWWTCLCDVGLAFKDGRRGEKDNITSSVKCYFVNMDTFAPLYDIHRCPRQARSVFMHLDTLPSLSKYAARYNSSRPYIYKNSNFSSCIFFSTLSIVSCYIQAWTHTFKNNYFTNESRCS